MGCGQGKRAWSRLAYQGLTLVRRLTPNQTHDPARGSFIVAAYVVKESREGPVFAAPVVNEQEVSSTIRFIPIRHETESQAA